MKRDKRAILNDIKCCIRDNITVELLSIGTYIPSAIVLRYRTDWVYNVELKDLNRPDVLLTCSISDISWPHYENCTENTPQIPNLAAFALKRKVPIDLGEKGIRFCESIILKFCNNEWHLIAELHDINKIKPVTYEFVSSVNWPSSGGGYICKS